MKRAEGDASWPTKGMAVTRVDYAHQGGLETRPYGDVAYCSGLPMK